MILVGIEAIMEIWRLTTKTYSTELPKTPRRHQGENGMKAFD